MVALDIILLMGLAAITLILNSKIEKLEWALRDEGFYKNDRGFWIKSKEPN